ncbi:MAG: hypothetical protein UX85_C0001G0002 [Candidatus Beckwithbacteria bacterium GW2011_GWB1_47_15]|uniref:Uncharacterized protein n=1 Tax=Candidatus Beckwithbacteria bacterium GW2011_GWB1_47_15 TaxID=1618371 RepID=A0A0G1U666_9BACT|nr:MAG: hypothetical protein UY43_C0001G1129 [Candidatus Beckwithbacteria bacterium GW2011_GWC1_49_16]AQS30636.1 hypothetical protein [uncultured bacterium]KKU35824.1 MAG: hypothetical protein UX50_C0001G0001 [Candidatus Beckwithbacteria bacterium GW2011_GWA1_46_30]KKU61788.1 MAG: hypothetical protein UX85_C0001G0002 [Candidatus Beckwithbacteria bacterium GW2011_GWB1_47_15]KKU72658.1 MAG: hypothetical protein UX97_C0001G0528 [Candidatus Beckwithbacteria bacterium GW2011_GWA2_47_25]KKW04173.1 M
MPPAPIKASTQDHLDIEDIRNDLVILKDGSCCLILQTTAVNFSLLSEGEQDATIYAYAGMLNSLTFPVQILIHSQKKNIQSYLALLNTQEQKIKNPLLKGQLVKYRDFITQTVKENDVLDKKFYIVIPFSALELGVSSTLSSVVRKSKGLPFDKDYIIQKAATALVPKRDHLVGQLTRLGLKAKQLTTPELIKLLFGYYNPDAGSADFADKAGYDAPIIEAAVSEDEGNKKL